MKEIFDNFEYGNDLVIGGLTNELSVLYMVNYFKKTKENIIIVTNSLFEATKIYNQMNNYINDVYLFPYDDYLTSVLAIKSPELKFTRLETLKKLDENKPIVIVTNLMGYISLIPNKNSQKKYSLKKGELLKRDSFLSLLNDFGYNKESIVTSTGEFAVRGLIIDVFPIYSEYPIRIEFDGDEIDSIRYFNESTQISNEEIKEYNLYPLSLESACNDNTILDYVNDKNVFFIEYEQIENGYKKVLEESISYKEKYDNDEKVFVDFYELTPVYKQYINNMGIKYDIVYNSKELTNYNENFIKLENDYNKYVKNGYDVTFYLSRKSQVDKIKSLIPSAKIVNLNINKGFIFDKYVVISDHDIEKSVEERKEYKGKFKFGKKIKSYDALEIGDYVVHISNGIGIYNGLRKITKNGIEKDYIQLIYSGDDKVYVPVEKISQIYKYGDKDGSKPTLSKLNGNSWSKTRSYIEKQIKDISKELIELYQKRLLVKSIKYLPFNEEDNIFKNEIPFTLTNDQIRSIDDILNNLQSEKPMDRLLCGDVGFGKTEVSFRAMFNTVLNNKQVMYLAPTTILSSQQFKSATERFKNWPIRIELLNRFVSYKKASEIFEDFKSGKIDILFGTHRILNDKIVAKDLGLLVVDEEQRFGVKHKEKIKSLKNDINVLTLSATPIPRTLKMALSGVRDLSVIETAPVNRYPIQTYVIENDDLIIKDAIYKELSRSGQTFILYNHVDSISSMASKIKELVPDARVSYAHGRMDKTELENIMNDFINHEFDVLVSTTIIESGIDIPNANTLIVYESENFGLAQLYQIRGRVGRSNKIAYAYLLYEKGKVLSEVATKRLKAIKDFTELGSGYKIAMRDLSIRGAGDIFGSSQAGFIDQLGINLYLKMVEDEIKRQRGEEVLENDNSVALIDVETHITDDDVSDEDIKIEIHALINSVKDNKSFNEVKDILVNRFGKLPDNLIIYMYEEWFEKLAQILNITKVTKDDRIVEIALPEEVSNKIEGDRLLLDAIMINPKFNISYKNKEIRVSLLYKFNKNHFLIDYIKLLEDIIEHNNLKSE